jgi:hypothetical protein
MTRILADLRRIYARSVISTGMKWSGEISFGIEREL